MSERILMPVHGFHADANIRLRHPAERGCWIWHPEKSSTETAVLRFRLSLSVQEHVTPLIHITADQRFQFRCDGRDVSFGPDRCDLDHWTVQSLRLNLSPGVHDLEALVWWIGQSPDERPTGCTPVEVTPPMAQFTYRGGFLLFAEGVDGDLFNTGKATWMVEDLTDAVEMERPRIPHYNDVGPSFQIDLKGWNRREAVESSVIMPPLEASIWGIRRPGWALYPAELPEQRRQRWTGGRIRSFRADWADDVFVESDGADLATLQAFVEGRASLTVLPRSAWTILWDLGRYRCGYPDFQAEGGEGGEIEWSWAEALYEESSTEALSEESVKGNRNDISGKVFAGIHDRWRFDAANSGRVPALWWRAGRYIRLRVRTGDAALVLSGVGINLTGYPLDRTGSWSSSDRRWDDAMALFDHSFRCAAHETWTDTPYYEQMCYVGDNIMHACANYAWYSDDRLSRRSIRLFEWSRRLSGLVAERYPSRSRQESSTYSLLWPMMVRDYAWWRDDPAFVREMLPGLRSVLAEFEGMAQRDGLLHDVPGWPFVDWVKSWSSPSRAPGTGPGVTRGDSSVVNLHWVLALLAASQVEKEHGQESLSQYFQERAEEVFSRVLARYWDEEQGLLIDSRTEEGLSEHAQVFALRTGLLDAEKTKACLHALKTRPDLARATISFTFYLLDVLHRHGEEDEFHRRLEFWRELSGQGFTCTPEGPEPSRSDSHAWGAHPLWHALAGMAGIRPAAPGFGRVSIAPMPGSLSRFEAVCVHPRGTIEVAFQGGKEKERYFEIRLPEGVPGELAWRGRRYPLAPGRNRIGLEST